MAALHPLLPTMSTNNLDNIGFRKNSTLDKFFTTHDSLRQKFNGMEVNHQQFQKVVNSMEGNDLLTDGAKSLNIGTVGEKILNSFTTQADALRKDIKGLYNHQEASLYSNAIGLTPQQLQLMGVIGDKFMKDGVEKGMDYLRATPYVEAPITFLAKAGVLGADISGTIIEKMNRQHTPDVLESMKDTAKALEALESTVSIEKIIIDYHSPRPEQMKSLKASKASKEMQDLYKY